MPIPFVIGGAIATGGAILAAHKSGKKKGEKAGYHRGKEEAKAGINKLTEKLCEFQEKKEETKDIFSEVVSGISNIDTKDDKFFSKVASIIRGYNNFHIFTMATISYTKYRCLEHKLKEEDSKELKSIVLGLIEAGFPKKLKYDISEVWESERKAFAGSSYDKYKNKLPKSLSSEFNIICNNIDELVKDFKELNNKEQEVNIELEKLRAEVA